MCIRDSIKDVTHRLTAHLLGLIIPDLSAVDEDSVIVAHDLTPSDTAPVSYTHLTAKTRMSGVDIKGEEIRKGAAETIKAYVQENGGIYPKECDELVTRIANMGLSLIHISIFVLLILH